MANLSDYFGPVGATAEAHDIKTGKTAYIATGSATGTGYFPAMMQYNGTTGYYRNNTFTTSGNLVTGVCRFRRASFTGGGTEYLLRINGPTGDIRLGLFLSASDHATAGRRNKLGFVCQNSSATNICRMFSSASLCDDANHTIFVAFSATAGTALFYVDGQSEDDAANAERVAPTTGTLDSGASSDALIGSGTGTPTLLTAGNIGFVGYRDAYLTNWSDFMQTDGTPKQLDEATWTEWGAQPLFWHESGLMTENKGSAGAMTANGTIILAAASTWS